jgi:hypothetical protein
MTKNLKPLREVSDEELDRVFDQIEPLVEHYLETGEIKFPEITAEAQEWLLDMIDRAESQERHMLSQAHKFGDPRLFRYVYWEKVCRENDAVVAVWKDDSPGENNPQLVPGWSFAFVKGDVLARKGGTIPSLTALLMPGGAFDACLAREHLGDGANNRLTIEKKLNAFFTDGRKRWQERQAAN